MNPDDVRGRADGQGERFEMTVRPAEPEDRSDWLRMRRMLWPEETPGEHIVEIGNYFAGRFPRGPWVVLIARAADGGPLEFAEVSTRPYAEGCVTTPVAYLEGWYVEVHARKSGVGRALVVAAEQWGCEQGATEFASDTEPGNDVSIAAHTALGFEDAGLVQCFRKQL